MPGITLKNSLITYYGNPAGYLEKDEAVMDSIFRNDELNGWLKSRSLSPRWTDCVMERLLAGEQMGVTETAAPLKNVRIWQLKPETDVYMKFIGLDELVKEFGAPDPQNYHIAYDGQLGTNDLAAIERRCIDHPPSGYEGHALGMSDVVELCDTSGSEFYYCDRFGFKPIAFEPEQHSQGMEQSMSQSL